MSTTNTKVNNTNKIRGEEEESGNYEMLPLLKQLRRESCITNPSRIKWNKNLV